MNSSHACVVSDARLSRFGAAYWDPRHNFPQGHWDDLLADFAAVDLFARVAPSDETPPAHMIIPPRVTVREAPYYRGPAAALIALPATLLRVWRLTAADRLFILRGPALLSLWAALFLRLRGKKYLVEVLGDVGEALRFSSLPLRRIVASAFERVTRATCRRAGAALYVIPYLEKRYPPADDVPAIVVTDARLPASLYREPHKGRVSDEFRLAMVANMEQPYKGHPDLLQAIAILRKRNVPVRLRLVGDGKMRGEYERLATSLGIAQHVEFLGAVAWGEPVFGVLDDSDLFVMASLTEGLPKALLEAMARGLPAVATRVGGFPDVLPGRALFPAGNAEAAADVIEALYRDPGSLAALAEECHRTAQRYRADAMAAARRAFYTSVQEQFRT